MSKTKYREVLSRYLNREITLHCSDFKLIKGDNEKLLLLLKRPAVMRIGGIGRKGNWVFEHLWVSIPDEVAEYIEKYFPLIRKLSIYGRVYKYHYKDSGNPQVGVRATKISILKYNKNIAKKYNLRPGQLLSTDRMDSILKKEGFI